MTTHDDGMAVRREVLGDAHVDRAVAATTAFTADFQDLITRYAWGEIWTRPGLDRKSRSMITLTALIARGHHEEFAMHVRAALGNGLTADEMGSIGKAELPPFDELRRPASRSDRLLLCYYSTTTSTA
ncbi:MAG: carboxymuconolactone decarboxylase family protein, partial [Mycolicibacterium frederiksbergense]|nr:carboxymuconolactone decarboxylase family protein [Mycolicibacterium frederiksbergense]